MNWYLEDLNGDLTV